MRSCTFCKEVAIAQTPDLNLLGPISEQQAWPGVSWFLASASSLSFFFLYEMNRFS